MEAAARQAYMAQAAATAREQALWEQAKNIEARLKVAEEAYDRGEIRVAVRLYIRMALVRPADDGTVAAKERLDKLAKEARTRQAEIDAGLTGANMQFSPHELFAEGSDEKTQEIIAAWEKTVLQAFDKYDRLVDDYKDVPAVGKALKSNVKRQRQRPEIAFVLNEPRAKALFQVGRQHEADEHACCAYWVYRDASKLAPAPSARKAQARLDVMEKDPKTVAAAEACREMQRCHQLYTRAKRLVYVQPDKARDLFTEVVKIASSDSEVYRAAKEQLDSMVH
jgi:hypothetical protein